MMVRTMTGLKRAFGPHIQQYHSSDEDKKIISYNDGYDANDADHDGSDNNDGVT
jgi:hypothetical protein